MNATLVELHHPLCKAAFDAWVDHAIDTEKMLWICNMVSSANLPFVNVVLDLMK